MKTVNPIRVVAERPALKPIIEPSFEIVNVYVEKLEENDSVKWILNVENIDGRIFKYELSFSDLKQ